MSCGQIEFLEGGALQNVTMIGGQVGSAVVQGCALDSCNLTHLRDIDTASAERIAAALAALCPSSLTTLAKALCDACQKVHEDECCCKKVHTPCQPPFRGMVPPPAVFVPSDDETGSEGESTGEGSGETTDDTSCACTCVHAVPTVCPPVPRPVPVVFVSEDDDDDDTEHGNG